jgi:hypothetical protein
LKFIFILFLSFFSFFSAKDAIAAEKINIKFEEMSIPLTIDQLLNLENYKDDSTEVIDWFKQNGFLKVPMIADIVKPRPISVADNPILLKIRDVK